MSIRLASGRGESLLECEARRSAGRLDRRQWERLRGARLFLTGASGFFGPWLLRTLLTADADFGLGLSATLLTRDPERFAAVQPALASHPAIALWPGDVRDFKFPAGGFSHIVHGATTSARETFDGANPLDKFDVTLQGTRRVLDLARVSGLPRLLVLGSGAFYGRLPDGVETFDEDCPIAPDPTDLAVAIGHAKRAGEFLCAHHAAAHGLSYSTARCFSFVGPELPLDIHYAIGNFIRDALADGPIVVRGDGRAVRSYMYVGDLAAWLVALLIDGRPGRAYNVGAERAMSTAALARLVGEILAPGKPVEILGQADGVAARNVYVPSIARARSELALDCWTRLEDAIALTADHLRMSKAG